MAIPKTLKRIDADHAQRIIRSHNGKGDGWWDGSPMYSDYIYRQGKKFMLLRPPCTCRSDWEQGQVSM